VNPNGGGSDLDADGEMELDADADGEIDDTLLPSSTNPSTVDPANSIPLVGVEGLGEVSRDCFLSTSLDGLVLVWDKRVAGEEKGVVRKFEEFGLPKGMGTGKEGKLRGKDRWTTSVSFFSSFCLSSLTRLGSSSSSLTMSGFDCNQ